MSKKDTISKIKMPIYLSNCIINNMVIIKSTDIIKENLTTLVRGISMMHLE